MTPAPARPARDISADIIRFLAVFIIINSHCDVLYPPRLQALATGGAIGDCLFLFVSGLTLSYSAAKASARGFAAWYRRRVLRIYPAVLVCVAASCLINLSVRVSPLQLLGGEFIIAIMVYYALLYPLLTRHSRAIVAVAAVIAAATVAVYLLWFPGKQCTGESGIYGYTTLFRWLPYSLFMLMGLAMGLRRDRLPRCGAWASCGGLAVCVLLFYGIQLAGKVNVALAPWQILSLLPLVGVIYFTYRFCGLPIWQRLYGSRAGRAVILTVGGVCLESYLIQLHLISDGMNVIPFPANLLLTTLLILAAAWLCHRVAERLTSLLS